LQLGPNNASNNKDFVVSATDPLVVYLTGGTPKYVAAVLNPPDKGAPKVDVSANDSVASVKISVTADTPANVKYVVIVSDAAGNQRQFTVEKKT